MTRSKEETAKLIAQAEEARDNAPRLSHEDARRLQEKWSRDSLSLTPDVITEPK